MDTSTSVAPAGVRSWSYASWDDGQWTTEKLPEMAGRNFVAGGFTCYLQGCAVITSPLKATQTDLVPQTTSQAAEVIQWNGRSWRVLSPPLINLAAGYGIGCGDSGYCIVIASGFMPGNTQAQETLWMAGKWSAPADIPSPPLFGDVSCLNVSFSIVSGASPDMSSTITSEWNGSTWRTQSLHRASGGLAPTCTSPRFCMIAIEESDPYITDIFTWNGTSWKRTSQVRLQLDHLMCSTPTKCVADGLDQNTESLTFRLWNGSAWTAIPTPGGFG